MFILYLILVLSTLAVLGAAVACYVRIKRHMAASKEHQAAEVRETVGSSK